MPQVLDARRSGDSSFDELSKALSLASSVYGVISKKQELDLQKDVLAEKGKEEKRVASGIKTPNEEFKLAEKFDIAPPSLGGKPPAGYAQLGTRQADNTPIFGKDRPTQNEFTQLNYELRRDAGQRIAEEKAEDRRVKKEKDQFDRTIPNFGVNGPILAKDKKQAEDASKTIEAFKNLSENTDDLIALRKEYGAELWNREAVDSGKQIAQDTALQAKELYKLGVLSNSDLEALKKIIPADPLKIDITEDTLGRLTQFRTLMERKIGNYFKSRGLGNDEDIAAITRVGGQDAPATTEEIAAELQKRQNSASAGAK